jgi:hypothetical protein
VRGRLASSSTSNGPAPAELRLHGARGRGELALRKNAHRGSGRLNGAHCESKCRNRRDNHPAPMSPALRHSQRTQDSAITFESIRALPIAEPFAGREPGSAFMQIGIPAPAVALRLIPPWSGSEKEQGGRYSGSHDATCTASIRLLITSIRSLIDGSRVSAHSARTYSRPRLNAPMPWA